MTPMDLSPVVPIVVATAAGAVVKVLVQFIKPWLEKVLKPSDPAHDGTIQFLVFALNAGLIIGAALLAQSFAWSQLIVYLATAAGGTGTSIALYRTGGKSSQQQQDTQMPLPVIVQDNVTPAPAPVAAAA